MQRESVIILIRPDKEPIARGNFKKLCLEFKFHYHSLKAKKLLEIEKNQIIEANNYKYVNLNLKAETYFENKYLCKDNQ